MFFKTHFQKLFLNLIFFTNSSICLEILSLKKSTEKCLKKAETENKKQKISDSEEPSGENPYEYYNAENIISEKLRDKATCLKPYQFDSEKELIADNKKIEEKC